MVVATRPKGLLNIPELRSPASDSFDTRPKHMNTWLRELPMGDKGACAKQIFHALKEINRLDISSRDRWRALELIVGPVSEMTESLEQHFRNQSLPIAEKNLKIADLCIELYRELALGYKILLDQIWTKELNVLNRNKAVSIIYHAMYFLQKILLASYEVYNDPPPNTWMHIHQLYLYAEDNHITHIKPRDITNGTKRTASIADLYIQIILLGLISPFRLRQVDTKKIIRALDDWSKHCKILPADEFEEKVGHVLIKQNSDYAPGYHFVDKTINHVYTRTLDSSALVDHIRELIVSQPSRIDQNTKIFDLPADVLKLIIITWSGKSRRLFSRTSEHSKSTVSVGINATHFMINNMQNLHPGLAENSPFAELLKTESKDHHQEYINLQSKEELQFDSEAHFEAAPVFGIAGISNASSDVWDYDYNSKSLGDNYNLRIWQESKEASKKPSTAYRSAHFENINESANGYCLFSDFEDDPSPTKVQVGELIGLKNDQTGKTQEIIDIGIIRRLKSSDKGVELGIQKLAPKADVVAVCLYQKRKFANLKYHRALLLPFLKPIKQPMTIIVSKVFKSGSELLVNKFGFKLQVQLTKMVETTGEFNQFEFTVKKIIGVEAPETKLEIDKGFDSVWTLI
ncbi:hypothetical protein [Kaarinaea lacus]